ncbi:hypothetical protein Bca101_091714 [Brassica carinata]
MKSVEFLVMLAVLTSGVNCHSVLFTYSSWPMANSFTLFADVKAWRCSNTSEEGAQVPEASQPEVVATGSDVKVDNPWSVRGSIYI